MTLFAQPRALGRAQLLLGPKKPGRTYDRLGCAGGAKVASGAGLALLLVLQAGAIAKEAGRADR